LIIQEKSRRAAVVNDVVRTGLFVFCLWVAVFHFSFFVLCDGDVHEYEVASRRLSVVAGENPVSSHPFTSLFFFAFKIYDRRPASKPLVFLRERKKKD
jgi:hypothetical protein